MVAQKQDTPVTVDCKVECRKNKLDGIPIPLPDIRLERLFLRADAEKQEEQDKYKG